MANNCSTCKFATRTKSFARLEEFKKERNDMNAKYLDALVGSSEKKKSFFSGWTYGSDFNLDWMASRLELFNDRIADAENYRICARFPKAERVKDTYGCGEYNSVRDYKGEYK